ncbi:MAG: PrsW family glutamic-type intramembrane protease [Candidatus Paceibacterota bacterium]|jgi:RsiW-degrading membrane proteinase PrsW (M82 family)
MVINVLPYALFAGVLPSFIWLYFWLREDIDHPEPRYLIVLSFLGGSVAVIGAIFGEKIVADIVSDQTLRYTLWAAVEEIFKLIVISAIALSTRYNDEPIDAMIYMITIAVGFSAIENSLFILDPLMRGNIADGIASQAMRFVGATLVHIVSSATIGFSLGFTFYKSPVVKAFALTLGLFAAIALHSLFNLSIISADSLGTLKIFMWIWAAVIILIVMFEEIKAVKPKLNTN